MLDRPQALFFFLLLALISAAWSIAFKRGRKSLQALGGDWRSAALLDVYVFKSFFSFLFFAFFFASCVLALAGLSWGNRLVEERRSGQEIVVVLDVSNSMLAEDGNGSRLERSLRAVRRLAAELEGVRIGLVAFKGRAVRLLPLTEDRYALETALRHVGPDVMSSPGSGLEEGIDRAIEALASTRATYRAAVLFSDGEYHSGEPSAAAARAGRQGVPLYVVAVGSEEGAVVRLPDGRVLEDSRGNPVVTRLRLRPLEEIAKLSSGRLFRLEEKDSNVVEEIGAELRGQKEGSTVLGMRAEKKDRFRLFLFLALLFLCLSILVKAVRWRSIL